MRIECSLAICVAFASLAAAEVVRMDLERRSEIAGGRTFGSSGAYEVAAGKVHFALDPSHLRNRAITDINRADRNRQGRIEFSADVYMLRPADLSKGNGVVLFEVVNRGKKGMLGMFNRARASEDPVSAEFLGDNLLLEKGYTLVWLGWQHDVPTTHGLMRMYPPVARGVQGLVRSEFTAAPGATSIPLGDAGHIPYPISGRDKVTLSVRTAIDAPGRPVPREQWTLHGENRIVLSQPAQTGGIYEVIYPSSDPVVAGVGLAAIRDLISFLRKDHKHAIGFGISQSAMVLRALLYEGFNQDENGKRVFDGILAHVAGARRSTFHRFTQPSRTAGPLRNASLSTTEQFPFSDLAQVDPATGLKDGLLTKAAAANVVPKIFYTNSSYEYWGSGASLLHTTPDGRADVQLPATTRMYVFSGGQHGPANFPPKPGQGRNLPSFNDYRWSLRSLLSRLHGWVVRDDTPPESLIPAIASNTLVSLDRYTFPKVRGLAVPALIHVPRRLDFGEKYRSEGVIDSEPPRNGKAYTPLVPQADRDGNDVAGLRMPEIDCAIGTFTGWNLRRQGIGMSEYLLANTGSYIPFSATSDEQRKAGDPRRPISDRFAGQSEYLACVDERSEALIAAGLLLANDKRAIAESAARHWAWRMQSSGTLDASGRASGTEQ